MSAGLTDSPPFKPPMVILDFDATITIADTIAALFNSAVSFHCERNSTKSQEIRDKLKYVLSSYAQDWKAFHELPTTKSKPFKSLDQFISYQRSLRETEKSSLDRVSESGLLGGISQKAWAQLAKEAVEREKVVVRRDFKKFTEALGERGGKWSVLSVNFCESWIRGVLAAAGVNVEGVEVIANEPNEEGVLEGPVRGHGRGEPICTSEGKVNEMRLLLERLREYASKEGKAVYIGDSGTDVECLLHEELIGVVMVGQLGESKLVDTLETIGEMEMIDNSGLRRINSVTQYESDQRTARRVWFARDFEDIISSRLFA